MKKVVLIIFSLILNTNIFGQINLEGQIGGSNFMGFSLNTEIEIPLTKNENFYLAPSFGLGFLAPMFYEPTTIIHTGLNLKYKKWGFGTEVSGFTGNPFSSKAYVRDFVDMLVYPNFNYTLGLKSNWYFKISTGAYFAFSKYYDYRKGEPKMTFEGDIIPGAGISLGHKFK